jgi:plastocyanin
LDKENSMKITKIMLLVVGALIIGGATQALLAHRQPSMPMAMTTTPSAQVSAASAMNQIVIANYAFSPAKLTVKPGTTITWTNHDLARHSVVIDADAPSGGPNGPLIGQGESFSFTFAAVGKYSYHCEPHPYMKGEIEVAR